MHLWKYSVCSKADLSPQNALHRARCYLKHAEVSGQGTNKSMDKLINGVPRGAVYQCSFILNRGKDRVNIDFQCRILMVVRVFLWIDTALSTGNEISLIPD